MNDHSSDSSRRVVDSCFSTRLKIIGAGAGAALVTYAIGDITALLKASAIISLGWYAHYRVTTRQERIEKAKQALIKASQSTPLDDLLERCVDAFTSIVRPSLVELSSWFKPDASVSTDPNDLQSRYANRTFTVQKPGTSEPPPSVKVTRLGVKQPSTLGPAKEMCDVGQNKWEPKPQKVHGIPVDREFAVNPTAQARPAQARPAKVVPEDLTTRLERHHLEEIRKQLIKNGKIPAAAPTR